MVTNRLLRIVAALAIGAFATAPAYGQAKLDDKNPEQLKLNKAEMGQLKTLTSLVDSVIAGKEPAPADVKLALRPHFVKSATNVFVPYVLEISAGKFSGFPVAMYVRAIKKGGATPADPPAFSDIYFFTEKNLVSTGQDAVQAMRAMELPPGEFDVHIAMSEAPARNARTPPKRVVHTQSLTVPDLSGSLTTSSIILAKNLEDAPQQMTPRQQMEQPFTIGGQRITPDFTATFSKAAELLFLFLVYNEGTTAAGKPDLEVAYTLHRGEEAKPFAKMATTSFNATTLPAEFNLASGHQVLAAQGLPLATFAPGEYKLSIAITDKTNNQTITRTVPFSVTP